MAVLKHGPLLALLNVLAIVLVKPECDTNRLVRGYGAGFSCVIGNLTINANQIFNIAHFSFTCMGTNVAFPRPPKRKRKHIEIHLNIFSCSPSGITKFVNEVYDKPNIYNAFIYVTSTFLSSADMNSLENIETLFFKLGFDTTMFISDAYLWSSLEKLTIHGGKLISSQLTEDSVENTTRLPANIFSALKSLKKFKIEDNKNIEIIGADVFRGLNELQILNITHSKLKYIESGAFSNISMLTSLDLSYNMLEAIPNRLFQYLQKIVEVFLQGNFLKVVDSHAFAQLPTLKLIDISNCTITGLSQNVFAGSDNIEILKVHQNNMESLPSNIFRDQHTLNILYLGSNRFEDPRNFDVFNYLKKLEYLDLSNNRIEILPKSMFLASSELKEIDLSNNKIEFINRELLYDKRNIQTSFDKIRMTSEEEPFQNLQKLKRLNLASNQMGARLYSLEGIQSLLHLEYLNLSQNLFSEVPDIVNENFTKLHIEIDLSNNILHFMHFKKNNLHNNSPRAVESTVILTGNPIDCDCRNYELYLRLNGSYISGEPNYILDSDCASPPHLKGRRLKYISPELLSCTYTGIFCLKNCSSCIITKNEMNFKCQILPEKSKIEEYLLFSNSILESISVTLNNQPISIKEYTIDKLNLSNAGIKNLIFIPNDSLKMIDVSHNNLSTLPDRFSKANYTLYLFNNPFECDCEFVRDIFALHQRGLVPDFNETTCANGDKMAQIDINELCNRSIRLISLIGCSTIGSFVALVTVVKLYLNAHEIWMSFLKIFCKRKYESTRIGMRELGIEEAKLYDLFISYAHQDENFVAETLLPKLENEFNQRVCVHTRDWVVGNVIANQIIESVENSRRTVIILSEHFLMSEWSEVEFHTAHNWSIQEGKPRIIIILLKEAVARDERMGTELKSYIASNTYLLWGDPLFWEKLQKVLPGKIPKYIW